MEILQRTWFGPVLVLGVIPTLFAVAVLGPQIWQTLTASIDLPVRFDVMAFLLALIWLVAALVTGVALWVAGWKAQSPNHRYRPARLAAAGIIITSLLVGGIVFGTALGASGCGRGRDEIMAELVPLGAARVTFSEDDIKDNCHGEYTTAAPVEDILAHHAGQLAVRGWTVTQSETGTFQRSLTGRSSSLSIHVSTDTRGNNGTLVQLLAGVQ